MVFTSINHTNAPANGHRRNDYMAYYLRGMNVDGCCTARTVPWQGRSCGQLMHKQSEDCVAEEAKATYL